MSWKYHTHILQINPQHHKAETQNVDTHMILHECSCFIEFIKRVKEKRWYAKLAEHFIFFRNEFNKFNYIRASMLDSIYHMTLKLIK